MPQFKKDLLNNLWSRLTWEMRLYQSMLNSFTWYKPQEIENQKQIVYHYDDLFHWARVWLNN